MPEEYTQKEGYQIHTKWNDIIFGGSALVGTLDIDYDTLVKYLGEPMVVNGAMIEKRWLIRFDDGTASTIFNYYNDKHFSVGGFGQTTKDKQNISYLKTKQLVESWAK